MKEHHCTSIVPFSTTFPKRNRTKSKASSFTATSTKAKPSGSRETTLLIIVASGSMKVYMIAGNGREQLLRLLTPGSYEGANALLGARAQDLFIDTLEATDACLLRKSNFTALLEKNPKAGPETSGNQRPAHGGHRKPDPLPHDGKSRNQTFRLPSEPLPPKRRRGGPEIPMKMKDLSAYLGTTPKPSPVNSTCWKKRTSSAGKERKSILQIGKS